MTQFALDHEVAAVTGEPVETIEQRGFSLLNDDEPTDDTAVFMNCPGCGNQLHLTGNDDAECPRCDAVFPFDVNETFDVAAYLALAEGA